ncbi:MAG: hypothetical protein WCL50_09985 [Spirochaetota bacterium]
MNLGPDADRRTQLIQIWKKESSNFIGQSVVDLEIDQVMKNRGDRRFRVRPVKKAEHMIEGMELPRLVGHDTVDHDRYSLDRLRIVIRSAALERFSEHLYQAM